MNENLGGRGTTEPSEKDAPRNARMEELTERLKEASGGQDEFAEWLGENWQRVLTGAALVLLGVWLYNFYGQAVESRKQQAAEHFSGLQRAASGETDGGSTTAAFESELKVLLQDYSDSTYGLFAPLYEVRALQEKGEIEQALSNLNQLSPAIAANELESDPLGANAIRNEVALLLKAKLLLDTEGGSSTAREILRVLSENGRVTNVEALVTLARVSESAKERELVETVARSLTTARPELADSVSQELFQLGINLKDGNS